MLSLVDILVLTKISDIKKNTLKVVMQDMSLCPQNVEELHNIIHNLLNKPWFLQDTKMLYAKATEEVKQANAKDIKIITIIDAQFPDRLRYISNPPIILFVKGEVSILNAPLSVAVVGTREISEYGTRIAKTFSYDLAKEDVVIVSGLALGCDTQAHLGCLSANGKTIAVLAHGLDTIYPFTNIALAEDIIKKGGCLVSEYPLGVKPQKFHFIHRNRIQSGLSQATIVIESKKQGGTLTTAKYCKEQGRLLYCFQPTSGVNKLIFEGNSLLIKSGAIPIKDDAVKDVLIGIKKTIAMDLTSDNTLFSTYSIFKMEPKKRTRELVLTQNDTQKVNKKNISNPGIIL